MFKIIDIMQKITIPQGLIIGLLILSVYFNRGTISKERIDSKTLSIVEKYLVDIDKRGEKIIIFIGAGPMFLNGQIIHFYNRVPIEEFNKELEKENYTVITLSSPCTKDCFDEYTELALFINKIQPEGVIFKGIFSDQGSDMFNELLQKDNIPLYTFGSEMVLDYALYVGPNNKALGIKAAEGIKPLIKPGDKAIYIETSRLEGRKILDNGYERINSARELLSSYGVENSLTIFSYWSESITYEEIYNFLRKEGEVQYIIAPSVETARGAAKAVEATNSKNTKIICLDFTDEAKNLLIQDRIYAAVSQDLIEQGYYLGQAIIKKTNTNNKLKAKHLTVGDFITKKTLPNYLIKGEEYKW